MKVVLSVTPGFSEHLAGWEATLLVRGRGSVRSHWIQDGVLQERSTSRYAFGLTEDAFLRLLSRLRGIPERFQNFDVDDVMVRRVRLLHEDGEVARQRFVFGLATVDELRFDSIWMELFELVRPALRKIGTPDEIVELA